MREKLLKIDARKSLGQHFLNNSRVPEAMAEAAGVIKGDIVLEIGPGTGVLTKTLLEKGAQVIGIEADLRAITALKETFPEEIMAKKLVISHSDAREIDYTALGLRPSAFKVVANIPYYLSGLLFRTFLENPVKPRELVFLVQKEVAERIAKDKKESLLSLSVKVFGTPRYIKSVSKGNFTPPPKIDSAIIAISDISNQAFVDLDQNFFFSVLHEGFKSKRKQLIGNLQYRFDRNKLIHIFSTLDIREDVRAEDLPVEEWLRLVRELSLLTESTHNSHS